MMVSIVKVLAVSIHFKRPNIEKRTWTVFFFFSRLGGASILISQYNQSVTHEKEIYQLILV